MKKSLLSMVVIVASFVAVTTTGCKKNEPKSNPNPEKLEAIEKDILELEKNALELKKNTLGLKIKIMPLDAILKNKIGEADKNKKELTNAYTEYLSSCITLAKLVKNSNVATPADKQNAEIYAPQIPEFEAHINAINELKDEEKAIMGALIFSSSTLIDDKNTAESFKEDMDAQISNNSLSPKLKLSIDAIKILALIMPKQNQHSK